MADSEKDPEDNTKKTVLQYKEDNSTKADVVLGQYKILKSNNSIKLEYHFSDELKELDRTKNPNVNNEEYNICRNKCKVGKPLGGVLCIKTYLLLKMIEEPMK